MGLRALKFYIRADTLYHVHSPYLYELLDVILDKNQFYYDFDRIEGKRHELIASMDAIEFKEMGAGSRQLKSNTRKISDIAKTSLSPATQCQILYRLIEKIKPNTILEMGTSLGIATAYLASAHPQAKLISLEGDPNISLRAQKLLAQLNIKNSEIITGHFDDTLSDVLKKYKTIDIAFLDGNHTYEATVKYFNQLLPHLHNDSILILDDVHWTAEMEKAWQEIRNHKHVTASLDFFYFGILFFRTEFTSKVQHDIVPNYLKPWCVFMGI